MSDLTESLIPFSGVGKFGRHDPVLTEQDLDADNSMSLMLDLLSKSWNGTYLNRKF